MPKLHDDEVYSQCNFSIPMSTIEQLDAKLPAGLNRSLLLRLLVADWLAGKIKLSI